MGESGVALGEFLSTPSARRATSLYAVLMPSFSYFYPRPPRGGRPISGSDGNLGDKFLSTPSARRATSRQCEAALEYLISIHALREEGDRSRSLKNSALTYFYPRPPRGGRPAGRGVVEGPQPISIHALREEGDITIAATSMTKCDFYPRPPRGGRRLV